MLKLSGQTASTSFNIRKNKRNVEWLLKQSLNAFKLIQHRFNFHSTCFNTVEWGRRDGFNIAVQRNRTDVVSGPFAQALMNIQNAIGKMGSTTLHARAASYLRLEPIKCEVINNSEVPNKYHQSLRVAINFHFSNAKLKLNKTDPQFEHFVPEYPKPTSPQFFKKICMELKEGVVYGYHLAASLLSGRVTS